MAKKSKSTPALTGAEEFAGSDTEKDAIEKIAAAKAAAATEAERDRGGDNGGPPLDIAAWRRAANEYCAEMLAMEDLDTKRSEIAGRISSIRKVAKKLKVDWDVIKRYYVDHKGIRKGAMGAMVTEERRYRWLLKVMDSPLNTQFDLWDFHEETGDKSDARPGMDAELQGQHAYSNGEPLLNNPYDPTNQDTIEKHNAWRHGWNQAQNANARSMGRSGGEAPPPPVADAAAGASTSAH